MSKGKGGGRPYTFDVYEMLDLYSSGQWSMAALGRKYGKDHTTIRHSIKKFGVVPNKPIPVQGKKQKNGLLDTFFEEDKALVKRNIQDKYAHIFDEPVNPGKSYEDYMADAMKRPAERYYKERWGTEANWTGIYAGGRKKKEGPSKKELDEVVEEF